MDRNNYDTPETRAVLQEFLDKQYEKISEILEDIVDFETENGWINEEYQPNARMFVRSLFVTMDYIEDNREDMEDQNEGNY